MPKPCALLAGMFARKKSTPEGAKGVVTDPAPMAGRLAGMLLKTESVS